jgi:hypothetical protein
MRALKREIYKANVCPPRATQRSKNVQNTILNHLMSINLHMVSSYPKNIGCFLLCLPVSLLGFPSSCRTSVLAADPQ